MKINNKTTRRNFLKHTAVAAVTVTVTVTKAVCAKQKHLLNLI
ncbi:MAG: twin-arginine translocation signal domain-containing protein [Planctomycetaceae bacterium]|nr:twin-arginine translocation signal domain-containing protein [Planctomycetaceae bacterium]